MIVAPDDFAEGVRLAERRARIEENVVVLLLRTRREGMASARELSVTSKHFDQDDLACVFIAIEHTESREKIETLKAARFLLQHIGRWDESVATGTRSGGWWSTERLANVAVGTADPAKIRTLLRALKLCAAAFTKG